MARRAEKAAGEVQPKEQTPPKDVDVIEETGLPTEVAPEVKDGGQTLEGPVVGEKEGKAKEAEEAIKAQEEAEAKADVAPHHAPAKEEKPYGKRVLVTVLSRYDMFQHLPSKMSGGYHLKAQADFQKAIYDDWLESCVDAGLVKVTSVVDD